MSSDEIKQELVNEYDWEPKDCVVINVPPAMTYDNKPVQSDIDVTPIVNKVNELARR